MEISFTRPDDAHVHLRDGRALATVVPHVAADFARAVVMPNLRPPVITTEQALAYRERILEHVPAARRFDPRMTLYLTDHTRPAEIGRAKQSGRIAGAKLYPAGATTNSESGVTAIEKIDRVLAAMEEHDLPLLVHGEVARAEVDIFDRERVFLEEVLAPLLQRFSGLRVVLEHVSTREGVEFVTGASGRVAATITAHHLRFDRNHMLAGAMRPHAYCLPVLKRAEHRRALVQAATSDDGRFFLGTDSAPHPRTAKESSTGCAGCYTSPHALALVAEVFEKAQALDRLEAFCSHRAADFYGWSRNEERIILCREEWTVEADYAYDEDRLVPLCAGRILRWRRSDD